MCKVVPTVDLSVPKFMFIHLLSIFESMKVQVNGVLIDSVQLSAFHCVLGVHSCSVFKCALEMSSFLEH